MEGWSSRALRAALNKHLSFFPPCFPAPFPIKVEALMSRRGSGSRRPKVTARLLMQPRCEQGGQHLCASLPLPNPPETPERAPQCTLLVQQSRNLCAHTRVPLQWIRTRRGRFPLTLIHQDHRFSIPPPSPSLPLCHPPEKRGAPRCVYYYF